MIATETTRRPTEIAKEAANLARKVLGGQIEVIWFGSWPRGSAQPHSDIDLAVSSAKPIAPEWMTLLREAVEELPTLYQLDFLDLASVSPALRNHILRFGVKL